MQSGWTALHKACRSGHKKVIQLLLSRGSDINKTKHVSPLHLEIPVALLVPSSACWIILLGLSICLCASLLLEERYRQLREMLQQALCALVPSHNCYAQTNLHAWTNWSSPFQDHGWLWRKARSSICSWCVQPYCKHFCVINLVSLTTHFMSPFSRRMDTPPSTWHASMATEMRHRCC